MDIITRIKSNFSSILIFIREIFEDFLFHKSDTALRLEKFLPDDWQIFFSPFEKNNVLSFFSYENKEIREAIREIKYGRNQKILKSIAQFSGPILASYIEENVGVFSTDQLNRIKIIFIPIPSHKKRLNEKGWNQAEDIAISLQKNFPFDSSVERNILIKIKNTLHQTNLPRIERLSNLKNTFETKIPQEFLSSFFILVDDVSTTGSTLEEARVTLKRKGVKHVMSFSLARSGE